MTFVDGKDQRTITHAEEARPVRRDMSSSPRQRNLLMALASVAVFAAIVASFFIGRATSSDDASTVTPAASTPAAEDVTVTSIDAVLEEALGFHTANNIPEATRLYQVVLASDPTNKYAHFNLGQIAQTSGDLDTAITEYLAALESDPDYGPALYNSGLAYGAKDDRTSGIAMLRRALVVSPESARTMFNLGTMLIADGAQEEGAAFVAQAVAIDPTLQPPG